jgi:succinyl-CoA synthetase alpha subunit
MPWRQQLALLKRGDAMSILVGKDTRLIVQGITGNWGQKQTLNMKENRTRIVAGVSPGKGGLEVLDIPVYDTVSEAAKYHEANASILYVPARGVREAAFEAIENGMKAVVIISEGVPIHDTMKIVYLAEHLGSWVIGPNTPGIVSPGGALVGFLPAAGVQAGEVGIISRSGTLAIESLRFLSENQIGISTCCGIGGDLVSGKSFEDYLKLFEVDDQTRAVVLLGEIGGNMEEASAKYISTMSKPVVGMIVGRTAPPGKRMGHAGAIISHGLGSVSSKFEMLQKAGGKIADDFWHLVELVREVL